ncbi:MAG: nucleotidyltransferase domain-containing protein [Leeuwenhoekiella sp.]
MRIKELIAQNQQQFEDLCKSHEIAEIYAFGSSVRNDFYEENSDIDLYLDVYTKDPVKAGQLLFSFYRKVSLFFGRQVDIITPDALVNPILKAEIECEKILVYSHEGNQVSL